MNRRTFLKSAVGAASLSALPLHSLARTLKGKVRITDVKCMIVRGTWDWNLIKIETDAGIHGIGEAYWGWGVKDLVVNKLKPIVVGEDPLNVDKLYTKMLMESAGAGAIAGVTVTAASGIEIALWDLAGRILETPACNLLGGRFRDRVRFYRTMPAVDRPEDPQTWRQQVREAKAEKFGWTAFKFQGDGIPPQRRSRLQGARARSLHARSHAQGSAPHREGDGDRARRARAGHRLRRRGALEVRRARRHRDGERRSRRSSRCGSRIRCRRAIPR